MRRCRPWFALQRRLSSCEHPWLKPTSFCGYVRLRYRAPRPSVSSLTHGLSSAGQDPRLHDGPWKVQSQSPASQMLRRACPRECDGFLHARIRPACVLGELPSRLSSAARSRVSFSGIVSSFILHSCDAAPRIIDSLGDSLEDCLPRERCPAAQARYMLTA